MNVALILVKKVNHCVPLVGFHQMMTGCRKLRTLNEEFYNL
jgi:hypothetical protein